MINQIKYIICVWSLMFFNFGAIANITENNQEVSFAMAASGTRVLSYKFYGVDMDMEIFPKKRWATGLSITAYGPKASGAFGFSIKEPQLTYSEISWVNRYVFFQCDMVRIGVSINNGVGTARLADKAETEKYRYRYGYVYRPKTISNNYYFIAQPGFDFSVLIFSVNQAPNIYLTGQVNYRFALGGGTFSKPIDYRGYSLAVGIALRGYLE